MAEGGIPHRGPPSLEGGVAAEQAVFPRREEEITADERVIFDALNEKYVLQEKDGKEWEWNPSSNKWIELVCILLAPTQISAPPDVRVGGERP